MDQSQADIAVPHYEAADVDENGIVEINDIKQIQDLLVAKIKVFTKATG